MYSNFFAPVGFDFQFCRRMRLLIIPKIKNNNKELAPLSMKQLSPLTGWRPLFFKKRQHLLDSRTRSILREQGVISTGPIFVGK